MLCDYLPMHIEVRWDGSSEDYTGLGKCGVWHVEPMTDTWTLEVKKNFTVDHPNVSRAQTSKKKPSVDVTRTQLPLAPERPVTLQCIQGTTVRGPEGHPKGLVLDLLRPQTVRGEERESEYFQHLYMALGRAQKLEWMLLQNFPHDDQGELDWSIFEKGPPDFLVEFLEALESRAKRTLPKLERAQRQLGMPAWGHVPSCRPDPANNDRFLYDSVAWGRQAVESYMKSPAKRLSRKAPPESPVQLCGSDAKGVAAIETRHIHAGKIDCTPMRKRSARAISPAQSEPQKDDMPSPFTGGRKSALVASPGLCLARPRQWWCSLLEKHIGSPMPRPKPAWFNDPACGAVSNGTQDGLTCGMFAVNHCLARRDLPMIGLLEFREHAGDGCYPEGDFDNEGLQRNLQARSCFIDHLQGAAYEEAVRRLNPPGHLSIFNGSHVLGCIIHMPNPRHWIAVVSPVQQATEEVAALLCDSLEDIVYALSADEMVDLFTTMALRHLQYAAMPLTPQVREELAAGWSAYKVTC